jgi:hypothetical protein
VTQPEIQLPTIIFRAFSFVISERNMVEGRGLIRLANTSEKSVNFYQTTPRNSPEDSHIHDKLVLYPLS